MKRLKSFMLDTIGNVHLTFFQKELPDALAIYFHEMDDWQMPKLDEALSFFASEGYRTVSPRGFVSPGKPGDKRLFLSFDDNFRGWHRALPLLERHGARCTFYLNTGMIRDIAGPSEIAGYFARIDYEGDDTTLSRAEILDLHRAGHTIGCHTRTHPVLTRLPHALWDEEILRCKSEVEELTGAPVHDFSFPFGMRRHFNAGLRDYCVGIGLRTIATGLSGMQHIEAPDPLNLHRTGWRFDLPLEVNLARLRVRSSLYVGITGRCAIGGSNWLAVPLPLVW